jgi:hypothetical protein
VSKQVPKDSIRDAPSLEFRLGVYLLVVHRVVDEFSHRPEHNHVVAALGPAPLDDVGDVDVRLAKNLLKD